MKYQTVRQDEVDRLLVRCDRCNRDWRFETEADARKYVRDHGRRHVEADRA